MDAKKHVKKMFQFLMENTDQMGYPIVEINCVVGGHTDQEKERNDER